MIDARGMTTEYKTGLHDPKVGEEGEEEQLWSLIDNPDSGKTWLLPDVMNKPSYTWDSRGYSQRMKYDIAQRPLKKWVQAPTSSNEVLKQKTVYGETVNSPRTDNLLGQVFEQYDQAGRQSYTAYDFKGNLKTEARQFAQVFDAVLDYSGNVALNIDTYNTSYSYDALDRPTSKTTPDNSTATYNYAKNAMLQSQSIEVRASGNEEQAINDITYNAKGQRTDIYYANGSKTKYVYNLETFRIIRILTTRNNGQEILQDINYTFDAAGNITQQRDDAQQTIYFSNQVVQTLSKYTYDSLYRLKKATGRENSNLNQPSHEDIPIRTPIPDGTSDACRNYTLNYTYDELGNILQIQHIAQNGNWTRNYFYPSDSNRLKGHTSGQVDYTYDTAGNMLSMPHLNNMAWDEDDMLVEADLGGGGTAYYCYDSGGNRVRKVIVNGNVKKERLYVGEWELWQQSSSGTIQTERETLSISDDQNSFLQLETLTINNGNTVATPNTNWRYQYDNHLGSACLELDDSANIISYEEYYPFGTTSYRSGKSQSEVKLKRYRYCGKERDEETGFYYYGARYYAAWIGRFISIDPLAEKFPQLTPYNYAGNKCITHKDLEGLQSTDDNEEDVNENKPQPRDEYEEEILADDPDIVYTANYGWVDTSHAFEESDRPYIGASNLWNQILNEKGVKSNTPSGEKGFKVTYRQDASVFGMKLGVTKSYFVKSGLSIEKKEQVALAIFQEVSIEFEKFQALGVVIGRGDSTFEPADLPSNMLGFYSAVRGISEEKIMDLINPLTPEESISVYRQYPGTFTDKKYKNYSFEPSFFKNKFSPSSPKIPKELQAIKPAEKGKLFRDWMPLFDIYGGKPPLRGLKY
jgi:RHS repeat-associated protein